MIHVLWKKFQLFFIFQWLKFNQWNPLGIMKNSLNQSLLVNCDKLFFYKFISVHLWLTQTSLCLWFWNSVHNVLQWQSYQQIPNQKSFSNSNQTKRIKCNPLQLPCQATYFKKGEREIETIIIIQKSTIKMHLFVIST